MNQITIDGPKKLLNTIPTIIKINPTNQMIVFGLKGNESKYLFHLVFPIPSQKDLTNQFIDDFCEKVIENKADSVVLIFYVEENPRKYRKNSQMLFENLSKMVNVKDLLWVSNGSWASYLCDDLDCCPQEGNTIEISSVTTGIDKIKIDFLKIGKSDQKLNNEAKKALIAKNALKDDFKLRNWQKSHFKFLSAKNSISSTDKNNWARLLVGLTDIPVRDALLSHFIEVGFSKKEFSKSLVTLAKTWSKVGSVAEPQFQSPIFACISAFLWQAGEFEASKMAVKLSLAADDKFRLAHLLKNALESGVPASEFRDVFKNPAHPWT